MQALKNTIFICSQCLNEHKISAGQEIPANCENCGMKFTNHEIISHGTHEDDVEEMTMIIKEMLKLEKES